MTGTRVSMEDAPSIIRLPGDRAIGPGAKTFVIAEAGVNHNGSVEMAHRLVDAAVEAGADAVKFQTFSAEGVVTRKAPMAAYQERNVGSDVGQLQMLKELELPREAHRELMAHCQERGILFLSTPHDWAAVDFLFDLGVAAYKIGSGDLTNLPFLRKVARKGLPVILSTGMGTLGEVEEAVEAVTCQENRQLVLLHCVTNYPASINECNLLAMRTMAQAFGFPVGYSDHTEGSEAALAAVALGAVAVEKHFTLDRSMAGPDHQASMEPDQLRALVEGIRRVEQALGDGVKRPTATELEMRHPIRKSIVAAVPIPAGTAITQEMLTTKRPGDGIHPRLWDTVLGRTARVDIAADTQPRWEDLT